MTNEIKALIEAVNNLLDEQAPTHEEVNCGACFYCDKFRGHRDDCVWWQLVQKFEAVNALPCVCACCVQTKERVCNCSEYAADKRCDCPRCTEALQALAAQPSCTGDYGYCDAHGYH